MTDLFVDSCGVRIAVRDYGGHGRPLVFAHGGPGPNLTNWDGFARRLAGPFRCVAYDHRGHGQSDDATDYSYAALASDIHAIVEALDLTGPVAVGHSWGGWIALEYSATYSECAGVVAVDGFATAEPLSRSKQEWAQFEDVVWTDPILERASGFAGTPEQAEALVSWAVETARGYFPDFSAETFRRDMVEGPDGLLRCRRSREGLIALNRAVAEQVMPSPEIYGRIRCPVMLVAAEDGIFRWEAVDAVRERYPHLSVERIPGGHFVQEERPDDLTALLDDFTASLPDGDQRHRGGS